MLAAHSSTVRFWRKSLTDAANNVAVLQSIVPGPWFNILSISQDVPGTVVTG